MKTAGAALAVKMGSPAFRRAGAAAFVSVHWKDD
jgi:hypothetical protein